ncbi:uncharacterized protein FA14DRAFT_178425 [Meira miltonrushii]|uniref:Uncharacterized protein n=1 Tax=Meira miltonrushii TaxID=1280837 RepID=A0A316VGB4_9BASI|nr:uncharacterized protein FA14DRAFT_178425 [Meira miltonrushii]PWN35041.1 hypothetical protein FA14DRAFT_178425 [Meira miltonrushii]
MFKRIFYTSFTLLCLVLTVSASITPRLSKTQSSVACTGDTCSMQRPAPVVAEENTEPAKKLSRFSYGKARIGNFLQRTHHQVKRIGYLADGKMHKLVGAIDVVDKQKASLQRDEINKLKISAQDLKTRFKEQRRPSNRIGRGPQLTRSSTVAGSSDFRRPVFSPSRE